MSQKRVESSSVAPVGPLALPTGSSLADWFGHRLEIVNTEAETSAAA